MNLQEQINLCYQHFYSRYMKSENYLFVPTDSEKKSIEKFIVWLDETFGKHSTNVITLFNFFAIQFFHYSKSRATVSKRYIQLTHIIGQKSIERWDLKSDYIIDGSLTWCQQNSIFLHDIEEILDFEKRLSFVQLEEIERKRFFNTKYGLSNCVQLTSCYSVKSETCKGCNFIDECKKIKEREDRLL